MGHQKFQKLSKVVEGLHHLRQKISGIWRAHQCMVLLEDILHWSHQWIGLVEKED